MKKTYKIKGMHCNSCAQLIENELKDKVNSVSVSYSGETAEIDFDNEKISEIEIKEKINKIGYEVGDYEEKNIEIKKENISDKIGFYVMIGCILVLIAILYFLVFKNIQLPEFKLPQAGENIGLLLLFAAGILTGFHCISMCGGFVVSYTAKNAIEGHKGYKQHFIYGGSKVLSYAVIGGIFGLIGGIFAFSAGLRGYIAIFAGVFMVFYALSMFGIKFFRKFQFNPKFLTRFASSSTSKVKGPYKRPLIMGLLNGLFIACGPLQAMYLYATGTGSVFTGATSLAVFGLGTLPLMIGFGSLATKISHSTTKKILKISAIIVLILGLIMLNRGLALAGSSVTFDSIKDKIAGNSNAISSSNNSTIVNGVQEINMNVYSSGYSPNSFVLKKGVPVKWNVNVPQLFSCTNELIVNAYGIDFHLKQGLNVIEFTPDKVGTIPFTCGMGMLRGSFIVTDSGTASQEQVNTATPSAGSTCSMGANGGSCGCGG
jgi:sulfite exporter TauE/SafE/copper chaperone CopZ